MTALALLVYAAVVVALGLRSRSTSDEDFWTAGRSLGGWSVGMSLSAGFMSISWSCVYAIQMFYWYGLSAVWLMTVPWMLALVGIYVLARRFGRLAFSQPEGVERAFGRAPARVVGATLVVVFLIWGGAEIYVAATLLAPGLGLPGPIVMVLIAALIAIYSTLGGFRAVIDTDRAQFAVVSIYLLVVAVLALIRWRGAGWPAPVPARTDHLVFDPALLPLILVTLLAYLPGWLSEADLWLRIQAARDTREARRGALLGLASSALFVGVVPAVIAIAALTLFPPSDPASAAVIGSEGEAIIAGIVQPWSDSSLLGSLLALGLITASMSTIDTCTNVVGLTLSRDLLRLRGRRATRVANAGVVLLTLAVALQVQSLWDLFYLSSGLLSAAVALPVLATLRPALPRLAVLLSSLCGFVATTFFYFDQSRGWTGLSLSEATRATGLEYLLFGLGAAGFGFGLGWLLSTAASRSRARPS